ncbi:glycoside hydrolase family 88 protein [Pseudescherichia vulneris]
MSQHVLKETINVIKLNEGEGEAIICKIRNVMPDILEAIDRNMTYFGERFPDAACKNGIYPIIDNKEWTTSFWTGQLWLAYEWSGERKYRELAEKHVQSFAERIVHRDHTNHHDLGFLYSLSCISADIVTDNPKARYLALLAADALMERYQPQCGIIQAWGELDNPEQQGRMIIDCNMNLPLLYRASEISGDARYAEAARQHIMQASRYIVRPDSSTYHTYYMDVSTGEPRYGNTHQGFSDDSCWARGQAWGIYGFLLNYLHNPCDELLELSQKLANYFINRLPSDLVCYWDLALTDPASCRDSSSSAITACGLLEMVKHLPVSHQDRESYEAIALQMVGNMIDGYFNREHIDGAGLLKHSVYHFHGNAGVDECCSWGDYFFMESLTRIIKNWKPYW